jgi:hypothetical protein
MPLGLRLTDGTNVLANLNDLTFMGVTAYVPAASVMATAYTPALSGGVTLTEARHERVTESVTLDLMGGVSAIRDSLSFVHRAFQMAALYQSSGGRAGVRVFVEFDPSGAGNWWRSELFTGRVELPDAATDWMWTNGFIESATLAWERRYYWEGAETSITLLPSGSTTQTIYNVGDLSRSNRVYWSSASAITGDLPAPLKVKLKATGAGLWRVYISQNQWMTTDAGLLSTVEAEAASGGSTVSPGSGAASNGQYKNVSWTDTAEAVLLTWTLSGTLLAAARGAWVKTLLRLVAYTTYTDLRLRWRWRYPSGPTTIWEGPPVLVESGPELLDLGSIPLPPYQLSTGVAYRDMELQLLAQRDTAGTHSLWIDYLWLAALNGFRHLRPRGYGVATNETLVDDALEGHVYVLDTAGVNGVNHYIGEGPPILGWPGQPGRVEILHTVPSGQAATPNDTLQVSVSYRPRRLLL